MTIENGHPTKIKKYSNTLLDLKNNNYFQDEVTNICEKLKENGNLEQMSEAFSGNQKDQLDAIESLKALITGGKNDNGKYKVILKAKIYNKKSKPESKSKEDPIDLVSLGLIHGHPDSDPTIDEATKASKINYSVE